MEIYPRITTKPGRCGGKPCIRGFNITVEQITSLLSQGASRADIFHDFGFLTDEDIDAALEYSQQQIAEHQSPSYTSDIDIVH